MDDQDLSTIRESLAAEVDLGDRRDVLLQALVFAEELKGLYELQKERADELEIAKTALERAAERARRAERLREEFVANCSHELRTPLTPIIGWSKHLSTHDVSPEQVKEYAGTVHRLAMHLLKVVDSLLRVATIQRNTHRDLTIDEVKVDEVFARVVSESASGREVVREVSPGGVSIMTEPGYFHEILSRLVENAVEFSPAGTPIRLEAHRIDQDIVFSVIDRGPGIERSQREDMFRSFTQGDGGTTREHGGLGVGLYICRELVDALGGKIRVEDTPGGGATFRFELPQRRATDGPVDGAAP